MNLLEKILDFWEWLVGPNHELSPIGPGSATDFVANIGDRVFFEFDSWELTQASKDQLRRQADFLLKYPPSWITIEGHCDERGSLEENLTLGERRASTVKNYLVVMGVPANHMQTVSYGRERPAVIGSNETAWRMNRRAVVVIG